MTPHLKRLEEEATSFNLAFTPIPLCCPARQSLLSSKWPEQHGGLWNYDCSLLPPEFEAACWSEDLRRAGYRQGYVGKWHVHPVKTPLDYGFDDYVATTDYEAWRAAQPLPPLESDPDPVRHWFGGRDPAPLEVSRTHWMADRAVELIHRYAAEGRPWQVRLDFEEPHLPCFPAEPFHARHRDTRPEPWDSFGEEFRDKPYIQRQQLQSWNIAEYTWEDWLPYVRNYRAMVEQIDDAVGRVLDALEAEGLADTTLVVFTADHGDAGGSHRMIDKHYVMYEEELRVPLILRLPGRVAAGQRREEFVLHALDLGPTLLEAAGLPVPGDHEGRSLWPLLEGGSAPGDWRQYAFATYNGQQFGLYCQRMIRDRRWKYVWNLTDVDELYDLERDPAELVNRIHAPEAAPVLKKLRRDLLAELEGRDGLVRTRWAADQLDPGRKI